MKILVIARLTARSGNNSTAIRISDHLVANGHEIQLKCVSAYENSTHLNTLVKKCEIELVIGIHAFRAGKLLYECAVPFVIIFGGTDINEHYKESASLQVMTKAVKKAKRCIAFNDALRYRALSLWTDLSHKIIVQPQAVEIFNLEFEQNAIENIFNSSQISAEVLLNNNAVIFLLIAGLRPVKDPLFLVQTFSEWHQEDRRIHLLIVGPEVDTSYSTYFKAALQSFPGVTFIDGMCANELHSFMVKVFAVVNSSISEGMASSILEAMALGVPVIARRNEGNSSIIQHRITGFLFDTPKECRSLSEQLLSGNNLRKEIVDNAKRYVSVKHSLERERSVYCELVDSILPVG